MTTPMNRAMAQAHVLPDAKALFDVYYQSVFRFFFRRGVPREEARDLTQETFLEALRARERYRGEAPAGSWVLGIARNVYLGTLRHGHRQKRSAEIVPLESWLEHEHGGDRNTVETQPLESSMARERSRLFRQAIAALSPIQRDCLLLRVDKELSYREIADHLEISIEAVKARLFQAKKGLRKALGEHFTDNFY